MCLVCLTNNMPTTKLIGAKLRDTTGRDYHPPLDEAGDFIAHCNAYSQKG